jgi:hypothetical protein
MFDSLNEEIRKTEGQTETPMARALRYAGIILTSALVFGALYAGILFLE